MCFLYFCCRADYWKSQPRHFCEFCKCWTADNKAVIYLCFCSAIKQYFDDAVFAYCFRFNIQLSICVINALVSTFGPDSWRLEIVRKLCEPT